MFRFVFEKKQYNKKHTHFILCKNYITLKVGHSRGWTGIQAPGLASMAAAPRAGKAGQGSKVPHLPNNPNPNPNPNPEP